MTVRVRVAGAAQVTLFAKVYDVDQAGNATLPFSLAAPVRVSGATTGRVVSVTLPAMDYQFAAGHRLRLVLTATDFAYATSPVPATYQVALASRGCPCPPTRPWSSPACGIPWWTWAAPAAALLAAVAILTVGRRRSRGRFVPELAEVPLEITGLTKRFRDGQLAVDDLSLRVEHGQILGLLGPNGAGKTTTLRALMGLLHPDAGTITIFGRQVHAGSPALSRLGAFVEGPGFLPHLSGRANLEMYWRAAGRPAADSHLAEVLEIAGLGAAIDRPVRAYSRGMRQRLAIAQAMLGLPDLLVLDEPMNGLDPPQIREMRDVLLGYAAARPDRDPVQPHAGRGRADLQPRGGHAPRPAPRRGPGRRDHRRGRRADRGHPGGRAGRLGARRAHRDRAAPSRTRTACWCTRTACPPPRSWPRWSGRASRWSGSRRTAAWRTRSWP